MMPDLRRLACPLVLMLSFLSPIAYGQAVDAETTYEKAIDDARDSYRVAIAKHIRKAKTVDVCLLKFDEAENNNPFDDNEKTFEIAPYGKTTAILKQRRLSAEEAKRVIEVIAKQLEVREPDAGAFCHYPVHGIRIYAEAVEEKQIAAAPLFESTFCWGVATLVSSTPTIANGLASLTRWRKCLLNCYPFPRKNLTASNARSLRPNRRASSFRKRFSTPFR